MRRGSRSVTERGLILARREARYLAARNLEGRPMMVRSRVPLSAAIPGTDVVQVYLGRLPGFGSPGRVLGGFANIDLRPGRRGTVAIEIGGRALSYRDGHRDRRVTPRGLVWCTLASRRPPSGLTAACPDPLNPSALD